MLTKDIQSSFPNLPEDISGLQNMVLELHEKMAEVDKNYERSETENRLLRERILLLQHQLYGRRSEKLSSNIDIDGEDESNQIQSSLFDGPRDNDNEDESNSQAKEPETVEEITITIPSHKRKKRGRKGLPKSLRRIEVVHDIPEEEKKCGCGSEMKRISEEVSEQLEMVPARFWALRHIRPKYACKNCEGVDKAEAESSVKVAPPPVQLIPKSISSPGLLSHILVSKFCDSLPFYRQEKQFHRMGLALTRATMCNWATKVTDNEKCKRLVELLYHEILSGPLINIDETPFQVLCEPDRGVNSQSFMWVFSGGPPGKEAVAYIYNQSKSSKVASDFLGDYHGYVQTDGYGGYDFLDNRKEIIHVGCWAHVRRKFLDVLKASGIKNIKSIKGKLKDLGKAGEALQTIRQLYAIEKNVGEMELTAELVYEERQKRSKPILEKFEIWLKEVAIITPPKSRLGKALNYTLGQWPRLIKYLDDGIIKMDNNRVENAVRPFVVGRKNWLFFEQPGGAEAGAILYSLIESAKANGLEPYKYFCYIFDKLPGMDGEDDQQIKALLPMYLAPGILDIHQKGYQERWKKT